MPDQAQVGIQQGGEGTPSNLRSDNYGALIVGEIQGHYMEWVRRGYVFTALTTSGVGVAIAGVGSGTTYPILWNPSRSVIVVPLILQITPIYIGLIATVANVPNGGFCLASVTSAGFAINASYLSTLTNATPGNMIIGKSGNPNPVAQFSGTAGVGTAGVLARILDIGDGFYTFNATAAVAAGAITSYPPYDFIGVPMIAPGGAVAICQNATAGATTTFHISFTYAELPNFLGW